MSTVVIFSGRFEREAKNPAAIFLQFTRRQNEKEKPGQAGLSFSTEERRAPFGVVY